MPGTTLDPEPGAGIALRIEIDDQHPFADGGERRRKMMAVVVLPTPPF